MVAGLTAVSPVQQGELWNLPSVAWLWLTVAAAVAHQVYTWVLWRFELYANQLTRWFGDHGFSLFAVGFALLGLSRLLILPLAVANRGSLSLPDPVRWGLGGLFLLLAMYLFYSVARYFSFRRALGLDHFKPNEARRWSLVDRGIFRFTSNGMYTVGFLLLWAIGLMFESPAALVSALFQHLYIWIHYYCTEQPDMEFIYGGT